ncbi:hypothetical protein OE88DRAFT_1537265 [Heliocybe sulcata]|uniref:F-box domain-containing protein n=1 Tax=Heliocybe sulcata TaxID=5364 RepID=A0A5C3NBV6_9AGAM|nr:hypothetical protein OE88DRAFT_1537265 [Heliocybe sulcata]
MIDILPTELLLDIIRLACCDGGPTACSLQLVSRTWKVLTETHKFHSVALAGGPQQIRSFMGAFEASSEASRNNLRHICLTTARTNERYVLHRYLLKDFLSAVAPTIETLVFATDNVSNGNDIAIVLKWIHFPRLTHLKLAVPRIKIIANHPPQFPRLTHVHLAVHHPSSLADTHNSLAQLLRIPCSESLISIRLSGVTLTEPDTADFFSSLFDFEGEEELDTDAPLLPPCVVKYIVQVCENEPAVTAQPDCALIIRMNEELGRVRFRLLPPAATLKEQDWKDAWLQVQSGERDIEQDWRDLR